MTAQSDTNTLATPSARADRERPLSRMLRIAEVESLTGLSRSTIYKHARLGSFPRQRYLGCRAVAWRQDEIQDWIDRHSKMVGS